MIRGMRGPFYWVGGALFTVLIGIVFFVLSPLFGRLPGLPFAMSRFWSRVLVSRFLASAIEVTGEEFIHKGDSYVIVSNHRSYIDILVAQSALKIPFLWLAKGELFKIPMFGLAMKILGHIPVEREKYFTASKSLARAEEAIRHGKSVWVFPEGTRTPLNELGRFKRGAFLLAVRTGVPLLPVVLVGSDGIFEGPMRITPRRVRVIVMAPVSVRAAGKDGLPLLIDNVRTQIQKEYDRAAPA
jgi:1-acyl-sn-glycerol-3-phosphate acyltransferase